MQIMQELQTMDDQDEWRSIWPVLFDTEAAMLLFIVEHTVA